MLILLSGGPQFAREPALGSVQRIWCSHFHRHFMIAFQTIEGSNPSRLGLNRASIIGVLHFGQPGGSIRPGKIWNIFEMTSPPAGLGESTSSCRQMPNWYQAGDCECLWSHPASHPSDLRHLFNIRRNTPEKRALAWNQIASVRLPRPLIAPPLLSVASTRR